MSFRKFSDAEREAYRRGKIAQYYKMKKEKKEKNVSKYGNFDADKAFKKALFRSYGKDVNTDKYR